MFHRTPHHSHGRGVPAAIGRLVRSLGGGALSEPSLDPFAATHTADAGKDMPKVLAGHAVVLGPLVKRHIFDELVWQQDDSLRFGWAQLPGRQGNVLALGAFTDRDHFSQVAIADDKGRVFAGEDPQMDTYGMQARFLFGKEGTVRLPDGPRFGHRSAGAATDAGTAGTAVRGVRDLTGWAARAFAGRADGRDGGKSAKDEAPRMLECVQGGIVGRDASGRMSWLASWLKTGNRYTLEQVRANLPASMRYDLEYRDAIAIAFFAAYFIPSMNGLLIGFGSGNIFRRLNREAPIGAIRRCLRDTLDARAHGMRASGLEDHFSDLMHEAGALDPATGLDAVHGAEPLRLYTSTYSGSYILTWNANLQFPAVLQALRIEGNLNRFANVSAWLERNARLGLTPIEDTVTRAQAAQIDRMLLEDPALGALQTDPAFLYADSGSGAGAIAGESRADDADGDGQDGRHAVLRLADEARAVAARLAEQHPDPLGIDTTSSEWLYRQTVSTLLRRLRLPFRFDVEFRSNLADGEAAIGFTTSGPSMMPTSRYDDDRHMWVPLDERDRAAMSTDYNLRVGLMMATLLFGADERIRRVSVHIDSIGLEEAIAEQDSAISGLVGQVLRTFERVKRGDVGLGGTKADPKDGDFHGDPSRSLPHPVEDHGDAHATGPALTPADDANAAAGADDQAGQSGQAAASVTDAAASASTSGAADAVSSDVQGTDDASLDSQFEDLMRGIDLDEVAFAAPDAGNGDDTASDTPFMSFNGLGGSGDDGDDADGADDANGGDPSDPLDVLRANPTVRTMVTVSFDRDALLSRLYEDGLRHPLDTYRMFDATIDLDDNGGLVATEPGFDLRDSRFAPAGAQEEPELSETTFGPRTARVFGTDDETGLSIQRADLLQRGVAEFHRLAADEHMPSVEKAQRAMRLIDRIADPELSERAPQVTSALIDGRDTPDIDFQLSAGIERERSKAHDLLFSGQMDRAMEVMETEIERLDLMYANNPGVPRYFNSYAERVVYNRLFATPGEQTVLIPDDLFYAHMEVADVLAQIKGAKAALPHLNAMVSYAPSYPLSHLKLAVQLARLEDWDSARAACLNALRVALDRDDAAFAYYRFAYCEWMRDQFATAAAAYIMSDHISPGQIGPLENELRDLVTRADSQCVPVPDSVEAAQAVLAAHDLPVWPHTEVGAIIRDAARVSVDEGMFVPARTLSVAWARMADDDTDGIDVIQAQFLRSLNA
ncbi:tetratricopeptide repeat protein [Bifidobacterium aerophilum]|uniref:Tetratricopeptide repeat protein n=1 Tax=Bifidobacterium aerophilum TaxID=1798155 RepID=A0A6N9Z3B4_9BIFI|nr:tetratricopeptide repeat protein [Bifidobacterium aerophilum]